MAVWEAAAPWRPTVGQHLFFTVLHRSYAIRVSFRFKVLCRQGFDGLEETLKLAFEIIIQSCLVNR